MRVFILCTGRSGSTAIIKACEHIDNFTCGHETLARELGDERFNYPDGHIEADNRLSWFLGRLDEEFGPETRYVHLVRDRESTAQSFVTRFKRRGSIIAAYCRGILMTPVELMDEEERLQASKDYVDTVNANIRLFLKDKDHVLTIRLKNIKQDFRKFWAFIGAEGDLEAALREFDRKHNSAEVQRHLSISYELKIRLNKLKRAFQETYAALTSH